MMFPGNASNDSWRGQSWGETESFWASYSDLMAVVLMVFALTTAMTMLSIGKRFVEPTEKVKQWQEVVQDLCSNKELDRMENVEVDCDTGALIIASDSLQFGFNDSVLGEEGKQLLREVVPKYLDIIRRRKELEAFVEIIEIAGHTDKKDRYNANPLISRNRAGAVLDFLLSEPLVLPHQAFLKEKAVTTGYADTRFPSRDECPEDRCAKARRVELAVRLKNSDVLREVIKILEQMYRDA